MKVIVSKPPPASAAIMLQRSYVAAAAINGDERAATADGSDRGGLGLVHRQHSPAQLGCWLVMVRRCTMGRG